MVWCDAPTEEERDTNEEAVEEDVFRGEFREKHLRCNQVFLVKFPWIHEALQGLSE